MLRKIFFVDWSYECYSFLKGIEQLVLPKEFEELLSIHVFYIRDTQNRDIIPKHSVIRPHESRTREPNASTILMMAYILDSSHTFSQYDHTRWDFYVVTGKNVHEEFFAYLDVSKKRIKPIRIDGTATVLLDFIPNSCDHCKIVFKNSFEYKKHNKEMHNYYCQNKDCVRRKTVFFTREELKHHIQEQVVCPRCLDRRVFCSEDRKNIHLKTDHYEFKYFCDNSNCPRSSENNGFVKEDAFKNHVLKQTMCEFCPFTIFCDNTSKKQHMKEYHKLCDCPCGKYYSDHESYVKHFYSVNLLHCLEDSSCDEKFEDSKKQALHHATAHFSAEPFYCLVCSTGSSQHAKVSFRRMGDLTKHGREMNHSAKFLINSSFNELNIYKMV